MLEYYFSLCLEYIFVVNWLRTLIFFFFWFVISHYSFLVHNYMFFPKNDWSVCFYWVNTLTCLYFVSAGFPHLIVPHLGCSAKKSLTVYECRVSAWSTDNWKNGITFRLPTHHCGLSHYIPKVSALFQFLVSSETPAIIFGHCDPQWWGHLWWSG